MEADKKRKATSDKVAECMDSIKLQCYNLTDAAYRLEDAIEFSKAKKHLQDYVNELQEILKEGVNESPY